VVSFVSCFSRYSLTIPRWLFTLTKQRSRAGNHTTHGDVTDTGHVPPNGVVSRCDEVRREARLLVTAVTPPAARIGVDTTASTALRE
jgi:hypothetical protein